MQKYHSPKQVYRAKTVKINIIISIKISNLIQIWMIRRYQLGSKIYNIYNQNKKMKKIINKNK